MSSDSNNLRVFICDDSVSVRQSISELINNLDGVELVGAAQDGSELITNLSTTEADLVIMDIVMRPMDGLTALRTIRQRYPDQRVAMLSSIAGSSKRAEEAFRLGAIEVLTKPFDKPKLERLFAEEKLHKK